MDLDLAKYLDAALKLLDPRTRELAPAAGDLGFSGGLVRGVDSNARTLTAIVSTPNPDRYEEIVEPKAFGPWLETFMSNPVFVAGHNYGGRSGEATVIGHWTSMEIKPEGLIGTAQFARTALAEEYWQLYAEKHMRAFSVGWLTHAWEMREYTLAKGIKKSIRVFTEVELIEVSAVAIPANRESLVRAASAGSSGNPPAPAAVDKELLAAIKAEINTTLTDPNGPIDALIREVVAAVVGRGSHGHEDDDLGTAGPTPTRGVSTSGDTGAAKKLENLIASLR